MKFEEAKGARGSHLVEPHVLGLFELRCPLFGIYRSINIECGVTRTGGWQIAQMIRFQSE